MNDEQNDLFAKWVEAYDAREPIVDLYFATPKYAQKTIQEKVEPYWSKLNALESQLPYECPECGDPDPEFYQPTKKLLKLRRGIEKLRPKAYRTIPNPDYDPERAAEYYEKHRRRPLNQTTITIGQSYNPDLTATGQRIAGVYSAAFGAVPVIDQNETPDQG